MTKYDGTTSLKLALEQLHGKKLSFSQLSKITDKYRERLNLPKGKAINFIADKLKIYQWESDAITQSSLTELPPIESVTQSSLEILSTELNIIQSDNDVKTDDDLNITQLENDIVPTVEPVTNELNITHSQNDSRDKFININYRHADNSRHTVQLEKFYIDALTAIGIINTAQFAADNAGVSQVTRNVKRAIVNELVKRATSIQSNDLNIIQPATQSTAEQLDTLPIAESNGQCTQLVGRKLTKQCKNKAFKSGYCKLHYAEYIKTR